MAGPTRGRLRQPRLCQRDGHMATPPNRHTSTQPTHTPDEVLLLLLLRCVRASQVLVGGCVASSAWHGAWILRGGRRLGCLHIVRRQVCTEDEERSGGGLKNNRALQRRTHSLETVNPTNHASHRNMHVPGGACSRTHRWEIRCARQSCSSSRQTSPAAGQKCTERGCVRSGVQHTCAAQVRKTHQQEHATKQCCRGDFTHSACTQLLPAAQPASLPTMTHSSNPILGFLGISPYRPPPPCPRTSRKGTAAAHPAAPAACCTRWPPPRRSWAHAAEQEVGSSGGAVQALRITGD